MIKIENISKQFSHADRPALDQVTFNIDDGEFAFLVGQSGAGKSTLVKMLIAAEYPDEGKIQVNRWVVSNIKKRHIPKLRREVGVVFQEYKLLKKKTARENVGFAMEVCGFSNQTIKERVPKILELVGLSDAMNAFPHELSGGERQRVAIARALVHEPKILLADEPTGNLDSLTAWEIVQLLTRINELGTTVLFVTHNKEIVNAVRKRVITMDKGKIIRDQKTGKYIL